MKDRFSEHAERYAAYRPVYPQALFDFILQQVQQRKSAWDVGTGNGQVASVLAAYFAAVCATDISVKQLEHAIAKPNINYSLQQAEQTNFVAEQFDLITVAQAMHWFRFDDFLREVDRTLKPGGILAVWGYGLIETNGALNDVIIQFYKSTDAYWDDERKHIDEAYANIPFPYKQLDSLGFSIDVEWTIEQLLGYFSTWSGVRRYMQLEKTDPVEAAGKMIIANWGDEPTRMFRFPLFIKVGRK